MITALLDTNVIMDMEDTGHPLSELAAEVLRRSRGVVTFYIHELQYEDIGHDENERRRKLLLSRVAQFEKIVNPPEPTVEKFEKHNWKCSSTNDFIDNALLLCVEEHAVSFLVTNDKGILEKAAQSGLRDRTLKLDEFEGILPDAPTPVNLAAVKNLFCYELQINDTFFDSLRASYEGFNGWFNKCCESQRKCWAIYRNDKLAALCIYKDEQGEVITDNGLVPSGKILKLCTIKVDELARGYKMGERLLYCAFRYAQKNGHTTVYFTTDEAQQASLVDLGHEFGFDKVGYHGRDAVYLKYMKPQNEEDFSLDNAEFIRRFYPSYRDNAGVGKYIVPINPQWHECLFPDISDISNSLFRGYSEFYKAEGNTIKKAYLTRRSQIAAPKVGDLLLFYRTDDRRAIDTMGVVVGTAKSTNAEEVVAITKRRTVYEPKAIESLVASATNGLLIISFDLVRYFEDHPVSLAEMRQIGISAPQTIGKLTDERFRAIMAIAK